MQFVKIGVGAQQTALGEACIANPNDVTSLFWNPAGLTKIENIQTSFHYTKWIADLNIMSAAAGVRLGNIGVLALSYSFMNYGDIDEALVTSASVELIHNATRLQAKIFLSAFRSQDHLQINYQSVLLQNILEKICTSTHQAFGHLISAVIMKPAGKEFVLQ